MGTIEGPRIGLAVASALNFDVWVMIGDFGCCTDPYDESQGLVEIIEDELSSYRGTLKHPLWMLRQESGDLICVEIRDHASTILPDPCVDPEDDHPQSCGAAPTKCPRTDGLGTARSPLSLRSAAAPAHIGTKGYPLRYSGGASSALGDRQCARFPQERRFRGESGALAHIRRGHCTEVATPFAGYGRPGSVSRLPACARLSGVW